MNQIWLAFITGITTGGISCLAVQGGLLASSMAQEDGAAIARKSKFTHVALFLLAKIVVYTLLGFVLGLIGSSVVISPSLQGWFQIFVGAFMLVTAARLLNLHPVFRYFVIQPPKFVYRYMRNQSKSSSFFAPLLLGALTIFIPCGVTQAMLVLAVASGSGPVGAAIMLAFTLGTSPVFFAIGVAALEALKRQGFVYAAAAVIFILGVMSVNTGQILRGSSHNLQNYTHALFGNDEGSELGGAVAPRSADGVQEVTITATSGGYTSSVDTIKSGEPVRLTIVSKELRSCANSFMIPSLGVTKILPINGVETIQFTPTKTGKLLFTCSMGMYTGTFNVI